MRSAGERKTQGKDELWKKRHKPVSVSYKKTHAYEGNKLKKTQASDGEKLKKTHAKKWGLKKDTCLNSLLERDEHKTPYRKVH